MSVIHVRGDAQRHVWIDEAPLSADASQAVWNHSPDGFNWGYGGSGPAQLALAILLSAGLDDARAVRLHQQFKWDFIGALPQGDAFDFEVDVDAWVRAREG